jgi:hypothetical protein
MDYKNKNQKYKKKYLKLSKNIQSDNLFGGGKNKK